MPSAHVMSSFRPLATEDDLKTVTEVEEEAGEEAEEGMPRGDWHADWKGLDYAQLRPLCIEISTAATIIGARLGVQALIRTTTRTLACPASAPLYPALTLPDLTRDGGGLAQVVFWKGSRHTPDLLQEGGGGSGAVQLRESPSFLKTI